MQHLIVFFIIIVCALLLGARVIKRLRRKSAPTCGCDCAGCGGSESLGQQCSDTKPLTSRKRINIFNTNTQ